MAPAGGNPGCMHSILNVLHHHHWSHVKRMLPHKRLGASSRHSLVFGDPASDKSATNISQVQEHINADTSKFLIGEKATEHIMRKSEAVYCLLPRSSIKSRIKALMTEDRSKRKGRHRRSSSCPTHTQLEKTNTSPHSESAEFQGTNTKRSSSDAMMSDPIQPKHTEEPLTKTKTCELCAAIDRPSYWKHKDDNVKELSESASLQASQLMDALDIFGTRKEFFLKILQDPGSPLVHYLRNRQAIFNSKTGLKKSVSFPVAGSASRKAYESSSYICNQGPAPHAHRDYTVFKVCNHNFPYDANKFKSIPTLGRPKSFNNLPPCTPRGLKTEHENKPVVKRFKKLRQKIRHVIRESRNEKQQEIIRDPVYHKIPYDRNYSKIMMEDTNDLQESVVEKCSKYCPTNSSGNDHSTYVCTKQIDDDNQCYRRTSSYSESFHRYCRFFESSFYNDAKHQFSARLKRRAEEETQPCHSSKKSLGRLLSLPDLRSYFTLSIEDSPCPSGIQGKTFVGLSSTVSTRLKEQKIPAVSVDQESQKLLDSQTESGAPKNVLEYTETPSDSDYVAARANSYNQREFEPTESSENLVPSSYNVVHSNSKEDTNCSSKVSITEDSLASQHGKDIDSLHVADNTCVSDQRLEIPTKQSYGDFLRNCVHTKNIAEFNYVKDILELSGFSGNEVLGTWHSIGQPLDPLMFEEVEGCFLSEPGSCEHDEQVQNCKRLLMFDLINEVLLDTHERSFAYFPMPLTCRSRISPMPVGLHVLEEVWEDISWYLSWRSESYQSLDDVVGRDLDKGDGWMNLQFDAECVGLELEDMIFEDLVDEMIFDDLLEELFWT